MDTPPWLSPRGIEETETDRRARAFLQFLGGTAGAFTVAEFAHASRFPPQAAAVAVATMAALGRLERVYDQEWRIWRWRRIDGRRPGLVSRQERVLTTREAAELTGLSEKAIRRRVERGTLRGFKGDRGLSVTYEALLRAGLLDSRPRTHTERGVSHLIKFLRVRPDRSPTTWELARETKLSRQQCEIALAVLRVARLVEKGYDAGARQFRWTWRADALES